MEHSPHAPVLLQETIEGLAIRPDGVYVDATLGRAGHSIEILSRITGGTLICIDRDIQAIDYARDKFEGFGEKVLLVNENFSNVQNAVRDLGFERISGILFDLGVSSPQLDDASRGFSYMKDAPLDMRMDRRDPVSAYDVVNGWEKEELETILSEYGEERYSGKIAWAICEARKRKPIETTVELVGVIKSAMPAKALREDQHPAKRSFQAIRIAVNDELQAVQSAIEDAVDLLESGGRIAVITFHSLEDRLVKRAFASKINGCTCPSDFPRCVCGYTPSLKLINKKPIIAGADEIDSNPRARSAKLRIAERL